MTNNDMDIARCNKYRDTFYHFPLFVAVAVLDLNQTILADDSKRSDEMLECIAGFFATCDVHVVISHARLLVGRLKMQEDLPDHLKHLV